MLSSPEGRLRFFRRADDRPPQRFRRGVYLIPGLFTMGNMWCGYACIVNAMRGDYETAAPFIGFAYLLDALDGRIARLTGAESEFGLQLDSLADVVSFGIAPAVLAYAWGLSSLGRLGWAVGFLFVACAAMRSVISSASPVPQRPAWWPRPCFSIRPASTTIAPRSPRSRWC